VLAAGALQVAGSTASSLAGYLTVFGVCGSGALLAAVLLFLVPRNAFADADVAVEPEEIAAL